MVHVVITEFREIKGLKKIHKRLSTLPSARRGAPATLNKETILSNMKRIITEHANDQRPQHCKMPTIMDYHHEEPPPKIRKTM